nr:basic proline-rich protein-like [Aegilops tauschii subsp. strangulata]
MPRRRLQHTTTKPEQQTPPATPPKNQPKRRRRASQSNLKAVPRPCHRGPPSPQGATKQPDCRQSPADPPSGLRPPNSGSGRSRPEAARASSTTASHRSGPPPDPPRPQRRRHPNITPEERSRAAGECPGHHHPRRTRSGQGTPRTVASRHHGRPPRCPRSRSGGATVESPWPPPPQLPGAEPCHGTAARSSMPPSRRRVDLEDISLQPGTSRPCPAPKAALPPPSLGQPELRWDEPSGGGGTRGGGEESCGG